ncbi:hypothetical protein NX009_20765 [Klebsiella pneumoniae]|nr:hypothetical protein [Klebsiella pneumoniae]
MDSQPAPALSIVDQARQRAAEEKLHPANSGETTSDVQMETAQLRSKTKMIMRYQQAKALMSLLRKQLP